MTESNEPQIIKTLRPFVTGGLAGCAATTCMQPVDMIKVQLQLAGETGASKSPVAVFRNLVKSGGFLSLYKGLDAGLLRQITYTTARMGIFRITSEHVKNKYNDGKPLPLLYKAGVGLFAGGFGSLFGTPADLALIRLQADALLPAAQRRGYTGVFNALSRILNEEGVLALWRGCSPTVVRAMALNMGMLASFDQAKEMLDSKIGPGWTSTLTASAISGWFAVTFSLPFDFLKTRIQRMKIDPITGKFPYRNALHAATKIAQAEGIGAFYTGYLTYYVRIAPHAMITLVAIDYMNKKASKLFQKKMIAS